MAQDAVPARWDPWRRSHASAWAALLALVLVATSNPEAQTRYREITSPGAGERLWIESQDFPAYADLKTWRMGGVYRLAEGAPVTGTAAVSYTNGGTLVFEVFVEMHTRYLHALLFYPDGRTPRLFVKQGVGAIFREAAIDPSWTPARLFPGFRDRMS